MKKILIFITLNMVLCLIGANAQPFKVEKAYKVKVSDKKVTPGMSLKENDIINIDRYLVYCFAAENTDYASAGNIIRGDEDENLMPVSQKAELADKENPKEEIAPTTIEMDSSDIDGETVTLFIVMP